MSNPQHQENICTFVFTDKKNPLFCTFKVVVIHCRMGWGRTGMVLAMYLMAFYKKSAKLAIKYTVGDFLCISKEITKNNQRPHWLLPNPKSVPTVIM